MLITNLAKFRQLSRNDRCLLVSSILLLPIVHLALLTLGYFRLKGIIERLTPFQTAGSFGPETKVLHRAREIAHLISIASQHGIYKASCLRRSLLLWGFLRREGIQGSICFGVRRMGQQLEAHAWVECKGIIVNDFANIHDSFQTLDESYPPTSTGL